MTSAQINISFERDCLNKNTFLLSQFLINLKGEDFVSKLLEEGNSLLFFCDVDSLGHIIDVKKIREKKELDDTLKEEIISALKASNIIFFICYERPVGGSECDAYGRISKDLFNEGKTTHLINIGFPGNTMALYQYERSKAEEKGTELSKLQYLINLMNKYNME